MRNYYLAVDIGASSGRHMLGHLEDGKIGNVMAAGYYIAYFLQGKSLLSIRIRDFSVKDKI